jgi:predicted TIM-barrel fold metal-dependent hydrolase
MPYCDGRLYYDADSHVMEMPDWLSKYVDPGYRDRIPPMDFDRIPSLLEAIKDLDPDGRHDAATADKLAEDVIASGKGYAALGASNSAERSRALDLLGVEKQLVFSSMSVTQFLYYKDVELKYVGAAAHNRAMAEWCADDPRLMGVGIVPLIDPERALAEAEHAIKRGCRAIWLRAAADGERSPGHPDLDPFWAHLEATQTPFVVHIGAQNIQIKKEYMNNGRPAPKDFMGGGEVMRAKDYGIFHQPAETFLSVLVLDGVLDRFPTLRGAAIEFGASWVPGFLHRLENVVKGWGRAEPHLKEYARSPYQMAIENLTFTTLPFEDTGAILRASSPDILMFGTDYPHIEGSRDPLGKMLATLDGVDDETITKFCSGNFAKMMGLSAPALT